MKTAQKYIPNSINKRDELSPSIYMQSRLKPEETVVYYSNFKPKEARNSGKNKYEICITDEEFDGRVLFRRTFLGIFSLFREFNIRSVMGMGIGNLRLWKWKEEELVEKDLGIRNTIKTNSLYIICEIMLVVVYIYLNSLIPGTPFITMFCCFILIGAIAIVYIAKGANLNVKIKGMECCTVPFHSRYAKMQILLKVSNTINEMRRKYKENLRKLERVADGTVTLTTQRSDDIKILRVKETSGGYIKINVHISNESDAVITDCMLKMIYDEMIIILERVPFYATRGDEITIGNIGLSEVNSITMYLSPLMCTSTTINSSFSYRDIQGNLQIKNMDPIAIDVICPIFFTQETANTAMLKNLVANVLKQQDSKIFNIPEGLPSRDAFEIAKASVSGRSVNFVREFSTPSPFMAEAWYYGVTKVKKQQMVMKVSVLEETKSIEIFAAAHSEEALTGLLAELGHDLTAMLERKGLPAVQITNINIKDSIIHKSSLLFGDAAGTGTMNYDVSDSIVHKSDVFPTSGSASSGSAPEDDGEELIPDNDELIPDAEDDRDSPVKKRVVKKVRRDL